MDEIFNLEYGLKPSASKNPECWADPFPSCSHQRVSMTSSSAHELLDTFSNFQFAPESSFQEFPKDSINGSSMSPKGDGSRINITPPARLSGTLGSSANYFFELDNEADGRKDGAAHADQAFEPIGDVTHNWLSELDDLGHLKQGDHKPLSQKAASKDHTDAEINCGPSSFTIESLLGLTTPDRKSVEERKRYHRARMRQALEEQDERERVAQREHEERKRVRESLNLDLIKSWKEGKEGNIRALLSTLQYVLWPECGWEAVSSKDLIAKVSVVSKVYRKATDTLQQKVATVQQKYIAEEIFEVLKEAWSKFEVEELYAGRLFMKLRIN